MGRYRNGSEGSAYWGFVEEREGRKKDTEADPDLLSEDDAVIGKKRELTDDEDESLSAYYRCVAKGALKELSPLEKKIWKLRFFQWLSEAQIAVVLDIDRRDVYKLLGRAGRKLEPIITKEMQRKYGHFNIGFKKGVVSKGVGSTDKMFKERLYSHKEEIEKWKERHPEMQEIDK